MEFEAMVVCTYFGFGVVMLYARWVNVVNTTTSVVCTLGAWCASLCMLRLYTL